MNLPIRAAVVTGMLFVFLGGAKESAAADQKAALEKIKGHITAATTAFSQKNFEKMKTELTDAATTGTENELGTNAIMAKVYVLMGVMEVTGNKNTKEGIAHFVKALEISPAVQVPVNMTSKPVRTAFGKAEDQDATATVESEKAAPTPAPAPAPTSSPAAEKAAVAEAPSEPAKAEPTKAETAKADKARAEAERAEKAKAELAEKARVEKESLLKEKDKLAKDKQDKDAQLTETKGRIAQIEKDKADKDKQLAAVRDSEKKERDAKDKLAKEKQDLEKQLGDAKARIAQLEKEKADKDKQLATVAESEKKEREAKDKLDKTRQELEAREASRKGREAQDKQERDKLAEGPALPGSVSEPIHCTMPDEIQAGADQWVHCVPKNNAAKAVVFHYRPGNAVIYNTLTMEKSKRGWYVATIPGGRINGKLLQYYVEARDDRQVIANNGQPGSPNIATIRTGGAPLAKMAASAPTESVVAAVADAKAPKSRSARRARVKDRKAR